MRSTDSAFLLLVFLSVGTSPRLAQMLFPDGRKPRGDAAALPPADDDADMNKYGSAGGKRTDLL